MIQTGLDLTQFHRRPPPDSVYFRDVASSALYALACVLVPAAWGLLMVWAIGAVEKRIGRAAHDTLDSIAQDDQV